MRVCVTGAGGFLGRHVTRALLEAGHEVRAIVRGAAVAQALDGRVELVPGDLRTRPELAADLEGVDAVVHLAAAKAASDAACFADTLTASERLFDVMASAGVRRLVLCSSFSVYDWTRAHGSVDETLPLAEDVYGAGEYAAAKLWQERLARRMEETHGFELTVLRPGFVWGATNACPDGSIGPSLGRVQLVFAGRRHLPLTYVENCADCFRAVLENPASIGETFNVVDDEAVSAWRFVRELGRRQAAPRRLLIFVPYLLLRPAIALVYRLGRALLGPRVRLPSFCVPARFAQGYRPLRYSTRRLREVLGWRAPLGLEQCLARSSPAPALSPGS